MNRRQISHLDVARDHRRQWRDCLYVYPVISRRARGLSVGVNLNLDKSCTFSCVYCQINRQKTRGGMGEKMVRTPVDLKVLAKELKLALKTAAKGKLWKEDRFAETPPELRRINDIAFSGDGEPTCLPNFDEAVATAAEVKAKLKLPDVKLIVITNATQLHQSQFQRAIPTLQAANGEVWAKLDAGTEDLFQRINRPSLPTALSDICRNIMDIAHRMPVVLQTLLLRLNGLPPEPSDLAAYCDCVRRIIDSGGQIKQIQLHTIARSPAEPYAQWLPDDELDAVAEKIRSDLPDVDVTVTYGADVPPQERH
jgi:wyosine [tRNA(Phe)-imidazoG37] synthetase (radical SAM superfamily)